MIYISIVHGDVDEKLTFNTTKTICQAIASSQQMEMRQCFLFLQAQTRILAGFHAVLRCTASPAK